MIPNGGSLNQTNSNSRLIVGDQGVGTLTVSGTGLVQADGPEISVGPAGSGEGVINLDTGGTIKAKAIRGAAGLSTVNFDGGDMVFTDSSFAVGDALGVDVANLEAGGVAIDTQAFDVQIGQSFSGVGGFEKIGVGELTLSGSSTATGTQTVSTGTLRSISASTFSDSATVNLKAGATLNLDFVGQDTVAEFEIDGVPQGPGVYNTGNTAGIIGSGELLVVSGGGGGGAFDTWATSNGVPTGSEAVDSDTGGKNNFYEFAFGGVPTVGNDDGSLMNAIVADSDVDGDSDPELLLTVLVRAGATFSSGAPATASVDGIDYLIAGGSTVPVDGAITVNVATTAVTPGLPAAPAGYKYVTFSLAGSTGGMAAGYFHATVSQTL